MKIAVVTSIPFPADRAMRAMRDRLTDMAAFMPNIDRITVEAKSEPAPGEVKLVNRWQAAATEVPAVARPFVKPEQMYWMDHAHWIEAGTMCHWRLEMAFMTDRIKCAGTTAFVPKGASCDMKIDGNLELDLKGMVPGLMLGKVTSAVEVFVTKMLEPNFQKTADALTRFLQSQPGQA